MSDWRVGEGNHFARSDGGFGIINIGYTDFTSHDDHRRLAEINPQ